MNESIGLKAAELGTADIVLCQESLDVSVPFHKRAIVRDATREEHLLQQIVGEIIQEHLRS